ncbi:MAG: amino acid ABC transporter permease [Dehalococcoidia bacterium]|nr:amino acid ABC transporter permease [Dehalococcoidia bacterium]
MTAVRLPLESGRGLRSAREVLAAAWEWARTRLFNSPANAVVSLLLIVLLAWASFLFLRWMAFEADWGVVRTNRRLLLVGRFPQDQEWRIWPVVYALTALLGWTWGSWGRVTRWAAATMALIGVLVLPTLAGWGGALAFLPAVTLAALVHLVALRLATRPAWRTRVRVASGVGWFLALPLTLALLHVRGGVDPTLWGGLYLNLVVASGAVMGALPLGIALALARTSSFRALRWASTVYVEVMRGLPLPVMLTLSWLALRTFLPSWGGLDEVALVYRVTIAFALFTAAFIAEAVRGGLNSIPRGQREAAAALGLQWWQMTAYVTMPQAIRNSLPALAGEFIGLFMTTTLVAVVGLTDMLQAARGTTEQPDFFGRQKEVLLFVGMLFWVTAFALSRLSARLERALAGKGTRRA